MHFTWDPKKAASNVVDHGVSFEEAEEVFTTDAPVLERLDTDHGDDEIRLQAIGPIRRGLVLVVSTERGDDEIRIISARFADRRERAAYRAFLKGIP